MAVLAILAEMANNRSIPPPVTYDTVSATEAKNSFGAVLDRAIARGGVAITKHDEVRAVLLPLKQYQALMAGQRNALAELEAEFDGLVAGMQAPKARTAGRALFSASPEQLGRAAVARKRRRG